MKFSALIQDDPTKGFEQLRGLLKQKRVCGKKGSKKFDFDAPGVMLQVCLYQKQSGKRGKPLKRLTSQADIEQELQQHPHQHGAPGDGQFFYEYRFVNPTISGAAGEKGVNVYCALNHNRGIEFK